MLLQALETQRTSSSVVSPAVIPPSTRHHHPSSSTVGWSAVFHSVRPACSWVVDQMQLLFRSGEVFSHHESGRRAPSKNRTDEPLRSQVTHTSTVRHLLRWPTLPLHCLLLLCIFIPMRRMVIRFPLEERHRHWLQLMKVDALKRIGRRRPVCLT